MVVFDMDSDNCYVTTGNHNCQRSRRVITPSSDHQDPVRYRRYIFVISLIDFLIGFLMMCVSIKTFPVVSIDDTIADHFGVIGVIWLFVHYSLQVIMAMILCGGTKKVYAGERSGVIFSRWFKASFLMCIMLLINNLLFYWIQESPFRPITPYLISVTQLLFRIFAMTFVIVTNRYLMFGSFALRLHETGVESRNVVTGGMIYGGPGGADTLIIFPLPPLYDDLPPSYEEATEVQKYQTKNSNFP